MAQKKTFPLILLVFELVYTVVSLRLAFERIHAFDQDAGLAWLASLFFMVLGVYYAAKRSDNPYRIWLVIAPLGIFMICGVVSIASNFDSESRDRDNLMMYAQEGRVERMEKSLNEKAFDSTELGAALNVAVRADQPEVLESLLAHGANPDYTDYFNRREYSVLTAIQCGSGKALGELVRLGADINIPVNSLNQTALHLFFEDERENPETLEALLAEGADPNRKDTSGNTPLHYAVKNHAPPELIRIVQNHGGDINRPNNYLQPPLFMAEQESWREELEALGARDISVSGKTKETALHLAALEGDIPLMEELIRQGGIPLNRGNTDGWSPLFYAAAGDRTEAARLLLERGADPDWRDQWNQTPLMISAYNAVGTELPELLIEYGADVKALDNRNNTLLHLIVDRAYRKVLDEPAQKNMAALADTFIRKGLDPLTENDHSYTPAELGSSLFSDDSVLDFLNLP